MLIDWFTVGAQMINFAILVWLLKRFLYKPILDAIDAREARIAAERADADAQRASAHTERADFERKSREFDQQRAALMSHAIEEARTEGKRLLDQARVSADALAAKRATALRAESAGLYGLLLRRAQQEVFTIARKTLTDLASSSLEERMCEAFLARLSALDANAKQALGKSFQASAEPALIRSAFELPQVARTAIQRALSDSFPGAVPARFETAPDVVCGIELTHNGQKIGWSIAEYLNGMEKDVATLFDGRGEPATKRTSDHAAAAVG
jgi:F-type H+-transporting ATPase subunit b